MHHTTSNTALKLPSAASAELSLPAPAKLNLMLHIVGRRADGYHLLETVFQFLDYADTLHFSARDDGEIILHSTIDGVAHDDNLIVRAARLLQTESQSKLGADIWLDKKLPVGGGIGGGSSNAATTLVGLNHLWQTQLSLEKLAELGLSLGADVPVFVLGRAAFAQGIGEKLEPVDLAEPWYLVAVPPVSISTAKIFSDPCLTRDTPVTNMRTVLKQSGHNDCQAVVEKRYPEVRNALILLNKFVEARLTGTGSCIFGGFPNEQQAAKVATQISESLPSFVAQGANISMLHRALQNLSEH
ncbi:MAG: 4-(cytidine 5'-diphospho)-2-C-methyl-D-erythritol kinase [Thiopseudomonas sp.]|jgi:4-diphosphocytidyl-2-C-methyl-D-erythritol kinase|nr:4-(cytidine 5'-diphospho)-2-C-methyl-D-erythritol kinase [Thiopseudomonas sp.]MBP8007540.1 4-(cytidine 5'-diphospho)-2-C-methyl-D-erythritol kinase [Thiopseudomonas sp.]MBP8770235.1 4-(cytidine 5'-diphospho)-2-C-methyl-D-erythritol kinase [Thiopseudomonas sp.]